MQNNQEKINEFTEGYEKLPEEKQKAMSWLIYNIDIAEEMSKGEEIPHDKMTLMLENARLKEDHVLEVLLLYKQIRDKNRKDNG